MSLDPLSSRLKAVQLQCIETNQAVVLKRGCTEIKISGAGAGQAVKTLLAAAAGQGATREEIQERFAAPQRPVVDRLIEQLLAKRLLVTNSTADSLPGVETGLDVFYWHFEESAARVTERLNGRPLAILGVNCIARRLAAALNASGWTSFRVVDVPQLRNVRMFDVDGAVKVQEWGERLQSPQTPEEWKEQTDPESVACVIATSDFGNHPVLREWNRFCIQHGRHFFPVILQNLIGYVGPLVVPGETACYECLRARQNSQMEDYRTRRAAEEVAFEGQGVAGFHPSMASVLGDIAAVELTKLYGDVLPSWKIGTLIEVNLLATRLEARKVLKIPRCPECSPLNRQSSVSPRKTVFAAVSQEHK